MSGGCIQQQEISETFSEHHGISRLHKRQDLLRRFSLTPYSSDLQFMGRTVRLESNSNSLLNLALQFFQSHQCGAAHKPEFLWRLVCEPNWTASSSAVPLSAFSGPGLGFVNIGQRGFLAVDLKRREAVGFLSEVFLEPEARLRHRPPLDILFCMTASSLGLVALSGGCVAKNGRGVTVFGPPNSGKTTACFLAARSGLEFQADQVVFLDARRNQFAWGDPFPAVFRTETLDFIPELREQVRPSTYDDLSFLYLEKSFLQPRNAQPVIPICSLFLERAVGGETQLRNLTRDEVVTRLRESVLFEEDQEFQPQILSVLENLAERPAYALRYDSDPKIAAFFIQKMLQ